MKKLRRILVLGLLISSNLFGVVGCSSLENEFDLGQFEDEMKEKGYEYKKTESLDNFIGGICDKLELEDTIVNGDEKYFIPSMTWIHVYSYENNEDMQKHADELLNRDKDEVSADNFGGNTPHFYKKGKIIVRYVGSDERVMTDLEKIMGESFVN